jgi:thiamine pyrophosphate-dependent acetolactate synthase large subunit-like protein
MSLMQPNVKWAAGVSKVRELVPTLEKAFVIAQEGVPVLYLSNAPSTHCTMRN